MYRIFFLLFLSTNFFSQTKTLTGVVSDTLNMPLENANIIANPTHAKQQLKFYLTNDK